MQWQTQKVRELKIIYWFLLAKDLVLLIIVLRLFVNFVYDYLSILKYVDIEVAVAVAVAVAVEAVLQVNALEVHVHDFKKTWDTFAISNALR